MLTRLRRPLRRFWSPGAGARGLARSAPVLALPGARGPRPEPGRDPAPAPRVFITIVPSGERTTAELGAGGGAPPRRYHAQVVDNLLAAPPRAIVFDLGFFEPTPDDGLLAAAFNRARSQPLPTSIVLGSVGLVPQGQGPQRGPNGELAFDAGLAPVPLLAANADQALANIHPDERGTIR